MGKRTWTWRIGVFALGGVILGLAWGLIGVMLARYDLIDKLTGFRSLFIAAPITLASALIAVVALSLGYWRKSRPKRQAWLAIVLAAIGVVTLASQILPYRDAPAMHDITTNVDDPPEFRILPLREDNLVPFNNIAEWRAAHREYYPGIAPVIVEKSPQAVLADARTLMETRGWDVVDVDGAEGQIEGTAYAGFIRFRDDVIVQVTPIEDGSTRVDMRSTSRVGVGDLGFNARRVEEFLTDLQAM